MDAGGFRDSWSLYCTEESTTGGGALPVLDIPDHQELLTLNFLSVSVKRTGKGKARGEGRKTMPRNTVSERMCLSVLRGPSLRKQEKRTKD